MYHSHNTSGVYSTWFLLEGLLRTRHIHKSRSTNVRRGIKSSRTARKSCAMQQKMVLLLTANNITRTFRKTIVSYVTFFSAVVTQTIASHKLQTVSKSCVAKHLALKKFMLSFAKGTSLSSSLVVPSFGYAGRMKVYIKTAFTLLIALGRGIRGLRCCRLLRNEFA